MSGIWPVGNSVPTSVLMNLQRKTPRYSFSRSMLQLIKVITLEDDACDAQAVNYVLKFDLLSSSIKKGFVSTLSPTCIKYKTEGQNNYFSWKAYPRSNEVFARVSIEVSLSLRR